MDKTILIIKEKAGIYSETLQEAMKELKCDDCKGFTKCRFNQMCRVVILNDLNEQLLQLDD